MSEHKNKSLQVKRTTVKDKTSEMSEHNNKSRHVKRSTVNDKTSKYVRTQEQVTAGKEINCQR